MNGEVVCLRGGREHKALNIRQFKFGFEDDREFIEYTGNGSKTVLAATKTNLGTKL